ncbi:MAG: DivIVA domain-containing protein [Firmicutes bacterium]|nr:DivIVA domain-containing protein [Bacillota bacterium]
MIKPADIQAKEFSRAVRGYREEEVNQFLDEITVDLDRLLNQLRETREENSRMAEELERLRGTEGTIVETLEAAKSLMADIADSSEKRADILLKNAELDAELMRKSAREEAETISRESKSMKERYIKFRNQYKALLESELDRFESLSGEMPEFGVDDFDDLPDKKEKEPQPPVSSDATVRNIKL